jgi:hypothetical protein
VNGAMLIGGGALYEHPAGQIGNPSGYISENGFAYPPIIGAAVVAAGGSLTSGTAYSYVAVYSHVDPLGHVARSAPTPIPVSATPSGGNLTVNVTVRTLALGARYALANSEVPNVTIDLYRSWSGGPYYFVKSTANSTAPTVTIADAIADSTVSANPALYTSQGFLSTWPPSGARLQLVTPSRVYTVGWQENTVQASKLLIPTAPVEFTDDDSLRIAIPEPITALSYMDGALIIFSATRIYVVTGDGPNDQGANGSFDVPRALPASIGCDNARSVVETPLGIMFGSSKTIYLLPRGFGAPLRVGDKIHDILTSYPEIYSAELIESDEEALVHFLLGEGGGNGIIAIFDLATQGWSVDQVYAEQWAMANVEGDRLLLAKSFSALSDVPITLGTETQLSDVAGGVDSWIESRVTFGDWRPFGAIGRGRINEIGIMGEYASDAVFDPFVLNAALTVDGQAEPLRQWPFAASAGTAGDNWFRYIAPKKSEGTAWTLSLYDSLGTNYSKGAIWNILGITVNPAPGLRAAEPGERQ